MMKNRYTITALCLLAGTLAAVSASGVILLTVDDFDSDVVGEPPAGWTVEPRGGSVLVSDDYALSGSNSLAIDADGAGGWAVPLAFQIIPIAEGSVVNFSGSILNSGLDPLTNELSFGILKLEFQNSAGGTLDTPAGNISIGVKDGTGAASNRVTSASAVGVWIDAEVQATAPAGAVAVRTYLLNVNAPGETGTVHFDVIPEPSTYALIGGLLALGLVIYRRRLKA